ncbi:hypothetical protein CC80DRAFT_498890 [Byssothecium circinans]|uniref:Uncharacterized protein n=1 Tax=Byssothecium circinans TaxID=147558 RepID=A0A6A5UJ21_9PLEO|nr:hypothetical protein CC80DRAFT_498890 [Byssothecium circinans]
MPHPLLLCHRKKQSNFLLGFTHQTPTLSASLLSPNALLCVAKISAAPLPFRLSQYVRSHLGILRDLVNVQIFPGCATIEPYARSNLPSDALLRCCRPSLGRLEFL